MNESQQELRIEGIVRAHKYDPDGRGKQFLGAIVECADGIEWVITYDEQSPFHAFAGRRVEAFGRRHVVGPGQHLISSSFGGNLAHFTVSRMCLVESVPEARLSEVGAGRSLFGKFKRGARDTGGSALRFVTKEGDMFWVANDPAGAPAGRTLEVQAYPVRLSASIPAPTGPHLWIICPHSEEEIWEWRGRRT